jgi:ribose 5-phosphate isomerase B
VRGFTKPTTQNRPGIDVMKTIVVGSDHAGFELKNVIAEELKKMGYGVIDVGTHSTESCDYPDFALAAATKVKEGEATYGILVCGTGIGISIAANKVKGIRCALCHEHFSATACRQHNDANMLAIGARVTGAGVALDIVHAFLAESFDTSGRHGKRLEKIKQIEDSQ